LGAAGSTGKYRLFHVEHKARPMPGPALG